MNTKKTIKEDQSEIATAVQCLPEFANQLPEVLRPLVRLAPPKGFRAQVSLCHAETKRKGRQIKRNAPGDTWPPDEGLACISYESSPVEEAVALEIKAADTAHPDALTQHALPEDPARDLVLALAKAEQDPQLGFVSLKWFRDTYLPQQGYAWAGAPDNRHRALVEAINRNWILTSRVPNTKNPQFPVTAIRVNRPLAEVRKILDQDAGFASPFAPITIAGEALSETVLRERR